MFNKFFLYETPRKTDGDEMKLGKDLNIKVSKQISDQCIPLPTILDQGLKKTDISIESKSIDRKKVESLNTVDVSEVKLPDKPEIKEQNKSFEVKSV